jgi:DNA replication and repair protein RecF
VFHVEPQFVDDWVRFQRTLKQGNAALKFRQPRSVTGAWDRDLVRYGASLSVARSRYVGLLIEHA